MLQIIFIILTVLVLLGIILLFLRKAGIQLQYLRIKSGRKPGETKDFISFDFSSEKERKQRWEAFLLFPMLYPITLDEKNERLNELKARVKRIHIGIYACLIALVILGVYSEKVFPS